VTARPACVAADKPWPPMRVQTSADDGCPAGFLQVSGRLVHHAELRHSARGASVLCFDLHAGMGLPFLVRQVVVADPAAIRAAEVKAARMVAGAMVHVYAHGCTPRTDHDTAALLLLDVTDVITNEEK
jgi:hypothetical protein